MNSLSKNPKEITTKKEQTNRFYVRGSLLYENHKIKRATPIYFEVYCCCFIFYGEKYHRKNRERIEEEIKIKKKETKSKCW